MAAGLLDVGGNVLFVLAREAIPIGLAAALVGLYPVVTMLLARFVIGEPAHRSAWSGSPSRSLGIVLISARRVIGDGKPAGKRVVSGAASHGLCAGTRAQARRWRAHEDPPMLRVASAISLIWSPIAALAAQLVLAAAPPRRPAAEISRDFGPAGGPVTRGAIMGRPEPPRHPKPDLSNDLGSRRDRRNRLDTYLAGAEPAAERLPPQRPSTPGPPSRPRRPWRSSRTSSPRGRSTSPPAS